MIGTDGGGRARTLVAGPVVARYRLRAAAVNLAVALVILVCLGLALVLGRYGLSWAEVWQALTIQGGRKVELTADRRIRRALAAVVFGACLGISGMIFQSLTRNPLGSPDVIGLNSGAYTGVVAVMLFGGSGYAATAFGAVGGSLVAAAAVFALSYRHGVDGFRLIIVGIAVGAILTSLNNWFAVKADLDEAMRAAIWGAGSLAGVTWTPLLAATAVALGAAVALPVLTQRISQLELGDDAAAALGLRVERTRTLMVFVGVVYTAAVTAIAGPIAFIALAAPQIARRLHGPGSSLTVVGSALIGALLLSVADLVAQYLLPGDTRLPVGAVTVVLGGTYLIWLLIRENGRR